MSAQVAFPIARTRAAEAPEVTAVWTFLVPPPQSFAVVLWSAFPVVLVWTTFSVLPFQSSVFRTRSLCAFYYVFRFSLVVSL